MCTHMHAYTYTYTHVRTHTQIQKHPHTRAHWLHCSPKAVSFQSIFPARLENKSTALSQSWAQDICAKHKLMTVTLWTPWPFLTNKKFRLFAFNEAASFPRSTGYGAEHWTRWEMRWCASPSLTSCTQRSPRAISWGRSWWWSRYSELSATDISSLYKFTVFICYSMIVNH